MTSEATPEGVVALDHTADVGLDVTAASLAELFARTALGMRWLLEGHGAADSPPPADAQRIRLEASELDGLLRDWLRELLFLHEIEGRAFESAEFSELSETGLEAEVVLGEAAPEPIREIKGVTFHGLTVDQDARGWRARVIFDV